MYKTLSLVALTPLLLVGAQAHGIYIEGEEAPELGEGEMRIMTLSAEGDTDADAGVVPIRADESNNPDWMYMNASASPEVIAATSTATDSDAHTVGESFGEKIARLFSQIIAALFSSAEESAEVLGGGNSSDAAGGSSLAPIYAYDWQWEESGEFTLSFDSEGRFSSTTDCNNIMGSFTLEQGTNLSFGQMASTKMACPGETLEQEYADTLAGVSSMEITGWEYGSNTGSPTLILQHENGEMVFTGTTK